VAAPVRALERRRGLLPAIRLPRGPAALAAGGVASVVTVMALRVLRRRRAKVTRASRRRKAPARNIIGTRSFLVDVHVLGR
jgi:hypothetical protein